MRRLAIASAGRCGQAIHSHCVSPPAYRSPRCLSSQAFAAETTRDVPPDSAIIFGWLGGRPRYLQKYAAIYERRGIRPLTLPSPALRILLPALAHRTVGDYRDRVLGHVCQPQGPASARRSEGVVLHVMSLAGYLVAGMTLRALQESHGGEEALASVRGVVLDSTPCTLTPLVAARGTLAGAAPWLVTPGGHVRGSALLSGAAGWYLARAPVALLVKEAYGAWESVDLACPRLMLFSEQDGVVPAGDVRAHVAAWRGHGLAVQEKAWATGRHVELLREDPVGYEAALDVFLATLPRREEYASRHPPQRDGTA